MMPYIISRKKVCCRSLHDMREALRTGNERGEGESKTEMLLYNAGVTDAIKEVEKQYLLQKLKKAPEGVSA
jgi:ribosomal protein S24E